MAPSGRFTEEVRALIQARASNRCEWCGMPAPIGAQIHHRKPRRAGGSRDPLVASPANGVLLHPQCHAKIESNRKWAMERGWVLMDSQDPTQVPVRSWSGWLLLAATGEAREVDGP